MRLRLWGAASALILALVGSASAADVAAQLDRLLAQENADKKVAEAAIVDDLAFLRRTYVDLIGRIPSEKEANKFLALPASQRRTQTIEELVRHERFADRWAIFFSDMFRIRAGADGGAAFQAYVHRALETDKPYDVLCRELISASGKAGVTPEVGFVLGDDADPMALAGVTSQVFLGVRMACAQCHDHPFDTWTRKQFYDLAAFFGKTRRQETRIKMRLLGVYLTETTQTSILWPPEDKARGNPRTAVPASFPFTLDESDGPGKHVARLTALRQRQVAEAKAKAEAKKDTVEDLLGAAETKLGKKTDELEISDDKKKLDIQGDMYRASALRAELAKLITDPRNRFFSRAIVNRVWGELLGRGFVNPVDDFKEDNPPSHPKTLDYLADEFVANGYDFRWLVKTIVTTQAYQRGHLPQTTDAVALRDAQQAFTAATTRRMVSEALYDSLVQAGHLFDHKHRPGDNLVTVTRVVQEYVDLKDEKGGKPAVKDLRDKPADGQMAGMTRSMPAAGGYDLERGIELDFKSALMKKDEVKLDDLEVKSNEELEAEAMMKDRPGGKRKMIVREIKQVIDDNPRFTSSMRMASPAPVGHFLRVFGQTDRASLDDRRDNSPSMRQALMMLNGRLTNEAARVGALEPMHALLVGPKADLDAAIRLAYREALTREPTSDELDDARAIVREAKDALEGMADLRWALLNSNEFRYLP